MSYFNVSLIPSFEILPTNRYNITLLFSVTNTHDSDCYVHQHYLMPRLIKNSFQITNENGEEAVYKGIQVKLKPILTLLKANETSSNKLILTNAYDFPGGEEFHISYQDYLNCCPGPQEFNCELETIKVSTTLLPGMHLELQEQNYFIFDNEF